MNVPITNSLNENVDIMKNEFYYHQIKVLNKESPVIFRIKILEGNRKISFKIFASLSKMKPNQLNCDLEVNVYSQKYNLRAFQ